MKKAIFFALLTIFSLGAVPAFATGSSTDKAVATESALTVDEVNALKARVVEIREMDKSELTTSEKSELKSELKEIKETIQNEPYIYIGGVTLLLVIILLIILL
ncbi:MAG: hypothetical protein ACYC2P_07365 [Paludibacteraceae bacterium]